MIDLVRGARGQLDRWLASETTRLEEAKVAAPEDEDRVDRMAMAIAADDLSRLDPDHLLQTARAALSRGDLRDARVRLMAAKLGAPSWKRTAVNEVAKLVDAAMDQTIPHRQAAVAELNRVHGSYGIAVATQVGYVEELAKRLARDPVPAAAVDPGDGATREERQQARAQSWEHLSAKLHEWQRLNQPEEVAA